MINSTIFIGEPLTFRNKCKIYPPTVRDVVGNPRYGSFLHILTISHEDVADQLKEILQEGQGSPSPFYFLLLNVYQHEEVEQAAAEAFEFFIHEKVTFAPEEGKIIIGNSTEDIRTLTEGEYFDFQNMIRIASGLKPAKPPEPFDPDEDPRIRRIKEKARERDRIKAKQGTKGGISMETTLVAICCMGLGINPLNIGEMSYASIGPLMKMMQEKEKYDIDVRSLLAGADSKKIKPKYWIRNSD